MIKGTQSDRSDTYMNLINEYGGYMTKENKVIADARSGKAEKKREKKANSKLASSQTTDKISEFDFCLCDTEGIDYSKLLKKHLDKDDDHKFKPNKITISKEDVKNIIDEMFDGKVP